MRAGPSSFSKARRPVLRVLSLLLVLAGCAPQYAVDGRPYALSVPADVNAPLPLIILLHGFGANADAQDLILPFSKDVSARRFFYALPNGTVDRDGKRFWNATEACCDYGSLKIDDVAFLRAVIADVKANHPVDPKKVFAIGHSNGGFMALRLACDASDDVTAVVSLAGSAFVDPLACPSGRPVSVLAIHGTADDTVLFNGGSTQTGSYPSAARTVTQMAARNGCTGQRVPTGSSDFLDDARAETKREATAGCPPGGLADLWTVEGAGHLPIFNDAFRTAVLDWLDGAAR